MQSRLSSESPCSYWPRTPYSLVFISLVYHHTWFLKYMESNPGLYAWYANPLLTRPHLSVSFLLIVLCICCLIAFWISLWCFEPINLNTWGKCVFSVLLLHWLCLTEDQPLAVHPSPHLCHSWQRWKDVSVKKSPPCFCTHLYPWDLEIQLLSLQSSEPSMHLIPVRVTCIN